VLAAAAWARLGERALRPIVLIGVALTGLAAFQYRELGAGSLSRQGRWPATATAAGPIRIHPGQADLLRRLTAQLDARDPARVRPVVVLGHAGWSYFVGRRNPLYATLGIDYARGQADRLTESVLALEPPAFVIDNRNYRTAMVPSAALSWPSWELRLELNRYERVDRAAFAPLFQRCEPLPPLSRRDLVRAYDCGRASRARKS
jgi:hypothetical protein